MTFESLEKLFEFAIKGKLPEWQTQLFCKYRDEVQVHSKGLLFRKVNTLFPNEHPDSKNTRILCFEPITRGSFLKGISNINRIFTNSSYNADASETTMNEAQKEVFNGKNLFGYYRESWLKTCLGEDPNCLMVVYPPEYVQERNVNQLCFVVSENIIWHDKETTIFVSIEESEKTYETITGEVVDNRIFYDVTIGRKNVIETKKDLTFNSTLKTKWVRKVFHVFQDNKFYRLEQQKEDVNKIDFEEYDIQNFDLPPCVFAEGQKTNLVNESFLNSFIAFGNLALIQHSQHMAVNFNFSFPRMSEIATACDYPKCDGGIVICDIDEAHPLGTMNCPKCNGTGAISIQSPYKIYQKKFDPNGMQDNENLLNAKPVEFFTPDVAILDYSKNEWQSYLELAEMAIFIQQKVQTGNVQSADSKNIDLDELHAFLIGIAKGFYHGLKFVLQCYENYYNASPVMVNVNIPYSFAILTEAEAFDSLNKIITSPAPDIIKGYKIESFINKFVSENSPVKKAYNVLKQVDVLLLKNTNEISTLKGNSIVTAEQWAIHVFAYPLLMQMYSIDETLFENEVAFIANKLETELVPYIPKEADLKTQAINQFGK